MKRGQRNYFKAFLVAVIIISVLIIVLNLFIYNYYLGIAHSINAKASSTASISLTVEAGDSTSPNLLITYPASTAYASHVTELDYSVSDANLQNCWYSLNSGVTNFSITCGSNATGISSVEGSNTWIVYANDTSGNKNSSSASFDVTIPPVSALAGGGGGGGGMPILVTRDFDVVPKEFDILIVSGKQMEKEIRIVNTAKGKLTIGISVTGIANLITLNTNQITLAPAEEKIILMAVKAPSSGVHAGKIIFKSGDLQKEIIVLVNVRSEKSLIDVSINVPEAKKIISPGEEISSFVSLMQIGEPIETEINLKYVIKNFEGETFYIEEQKMSVYDAKNFIKGFITSNLKPGDYIIGIEVNYPEGFATASTHFTISDKEVNLRTVIIIIVSILAIIVVLYSILRYKKAERHINEVGNMRKK